MVMMGRLNKLLYGKFLEQYLEHSIAQEVSYDYFPSMSLFLIFLSQMAPILVYYLSYSLILKYFKIRYCVHM
jgi:hypothetical protein